MSFSTAFEILRESSPVVSVGILTADLLSLGSELAPLNVAASKWPMWTSWMAASAP